MVIHSPDWTNTGFSFILLTVNLFCHSSLIEQGLYHIFSCAVAFIVVRKKECIILVKTLYRLSIFKLNKNTTLLRLFCNFIAEVSVNQETVIIGILPAVIYIQDK